MNYQKSLNNLIEMWIKNLLNSKSLALNTTESYLSDLKLFIKFLSEYKSEEINLNHFLDLKKGDIRSWFLSRKNKNDSAKTLSRGLSSIKSFMKYLIETKNLYDSEIFNMKPPKVEKGLPRPIPINKINDILDSISDIKQTPWIIKRDRSLLVLIYSVGLRINEALSLNKSDIFNSNDFINVIGKGSKTRSVPLIKTIKDSIIDYIKSSDFPDSEALFVNRFGERLSASAVQKLVKKSRNLLGLSDSVTPHALRHSCATHLMENDGDLRSVQELLGHSSISSTQIYADVAKKYISDIYDKCHPMSSLSIKKKK